MNSNFYNYQWLNKSMTQNQLYPQYPQYPHYSGDLPVYYESTPNREFNEVFELDEDSELYSGEYFSFSPEIDDNIHRQEATLTKTITSFHYPHCKGLICRRRLYRVYLEVKVPQSIASTVQNSLDKCMEVAKITMAKILAPFATPATYGGLPGAIPGALSAGTEDFTRCVGSNPAIYPHVNKIKLSIKTNKNA